MRKRIVLPATSVSNALPRNQFLGFLKWEYKP